MAATKIHKRRLEELLDLAQTYRGCNRKQLAQALGRDASNLVPDSGVPKVDLVIELARVMDWPVEDVVHSLADANGLATDDTPVGTFTELQEASKAAHREGRYHEAVDLAKSAISAAGNGEERALACNREAMGWDGLGRYAAAMDALQRGLREPGVSSNRRAMLQVNLANAYYCLWQLVEANCMAQNLVMRYEAEPPSDRLNRVIQAFAFYVRGNSNRRLISLEQERAQHYARLAHDDLMRSRHLYLDLAEEFSDDSYAGIANTCLGGAMEAEVLLGKRDAESVLEQFSAALDQLIDPADFPSGDWLESYGWWCIFGCNVALRHIDDERQLQQRMAIFTMKADEIAERLGNWSIRERVFTMEYARRQRFADWTGVESEWTIDTDDVRVITGTMGRFPAFRDTAWRILRTAKVIREN